MKIKKQKPHLKRIWEARRENSHAHVIQCTLLTPRGRDYLAFPKVSDTTFLPQQEREKIPPCPVTDHTMGDCHDLANKKSLYFELLVSSTGLLDDNSLSQVLKRAFLTFVSLDLYVVHH